jgi:hypothetical protein
MHITNEVRLSRFFVYQLVVVIGRYLVLPPVTLQQFQGMDCVPYEHRSGSFLRVDTSVDCNSASYAQFRNRLALLIVLYQMIPVVWLVLLYRVKDALNPVATKHNEKLSLIIRDENPNLKYLTFLFRDYRPKMVRLVCVQFSLAVSLI